MTYQRNINKVIPSEKKILLMPLFQSKEEYKIETEELIKLEKIYNEKLSKIEISKKVYKYVRKRLERLLKLEHKIIRRIKLMRHIKTISVENKIKEMPQGLNFSEKRVYEDLAIKERTVKRVTKRGYPDFRVISDCNPTDNCYVEVKDSCTASFTRNQIKQIPRLIEKGEKVLIAITCPDKIRYFNAKHFINRKVKIKD